MDSNLVYAVINGGYFDMVKNESSSFICSNGHVYHKNSINTAAKSNIYPTVGAFGVRNNNSFAVSYIYSFDSTFETY
jgi:exopolysaccharide biosynthesis protein